MSDSTVLQIFDDDKMINAYISEFLDETFSSFSNAVEEKYIESLDIPYATHFAMLKIQKMIDLAILNHDGIYSSDKPLEVLYPDGEPCPSSIDSWARGTVSVRKIVPDEPLKIPRNFTNETPSVSSAGYTSRSGTAKGTSRGGTRSRIGTPGTKTTIQENEVIAGKIIELDDVDGDFGNLSSTAPLFDLLQKRKKQKEQGYIEEDTEKGEFTILQETMDKASKDLKGKKFVLDRYGKPVILGSVNIHKLVPFSTQLGLNIKSVEGNEFNGLDNNNMNVTQQQLQQVKTIKNNNRNNSLTSSQGDSQVENHNKKKQFVRVAGSRGVEESSFKPTISLAVTLSGIEQIPKINAGVSIRSRNDIKTGDKLPEDPSHMSRKHYESSQTLSKRSITFNDNSTIDSAANRTMESPSLYTNIDNSIYTNNHMKASSSSKTSLKPGKNRIVAMKNIDNLPDIDSLEGCQVINQVYDTYDLSDEELGLGPSKLLSSGQQHLNITNTLPNKPTQQQMLNIALISGSPESGRPRDRDLPKNMRPITERKHLPAPPLGQITGHGFMSVEKYNERKNYTNKVDDNWHQNWRNA